MADQSSSVFHTRLFTFRVGEDGSGLTVHSGAVAAVSAPLKELMDEQTPDGPRTSAILTGIREEDLVRFCDFIYTNDYTSPYPLVVKSASAAPEGTNALVSSESDTENGSLPPPAKRARVNSPVPVQSPSFGKPNPLGQVSSEVTAVNKTKLRNLFAHNLNRVFGSAGKVNNPTEDHTNVLIAHAAMYVFATKYNVLKLKTLSLNKLKDKLSRMELFPTRVGDITALINYVYQAESEGDMSDIRDLVSKYAASEIGIIGNSEEFCRLLAEGGVFVRDFWALVFNNLFQTTTP